MLKFENIRWNEHNGAIKKILAGEITGVVILDALPAEECEKVIKAISLLKQRFYNDFNYGNGFSLPVMFGELHKTRPAEMVKAYFSGIDAFYKAFSEHSNSATVHLVRSLVDAFVPFHTEALPGFLPFSVRVVFPGKGGLYLHRDGELLPYIHDEVSERLSRLIISDTMMSWFFTLQQPEKGGELWIADSGYTELEKNGPVQLKKPDGTIIENEDELEHIKVKTPAGSLLLFKGGSYWHKVIAPAESCKPRVTLGGFMAVSRPNENVLFFWS